MNSLAPEIRTGGWWPRAAQRDLLQALLLPDVEQAGQALNRWRARVELDDVDGGSIGVLPGLARRLAPLGSDHPDDGRIRGLYRMAWVKNQRLVRSVEPVLDRLAERGITAMLLKGAPLLLGAYGDLGARRMADIDVLVHPSDRQSAYDVLCDLGLVPTIPLPQGGIDRGVEFAGPDEQTIDLQWRLLQQPDLGWVDDEFWQDAVPLELPGRVASAPRPAHLLFHVVVHGAKQNPFPPLRWVSDTYALMAHPMMTEQEWDVLVELTERSGLALPVRNCLAYVVDLAELEPPDALDELAGMSPPLFRRLEYRLMHMPIEYRANLLTGYVGLCRLSGRRPTPAGFLRLVKAETGALTTADLGREVGAKLVSLRDTHRLRRRVDS